MKIVIIGTGNVAQVLGRMLVKAQHTVVQVFGRNKPALDACAAILQATPITNLALIDPSADICIIATSDSAIAGIASQLALPQTIVVHTSGGVAISALQSNARYGVLYPLQSLRKELPYLPEVPLFVDGNTAAVKETITTLAKSVSNQVQAANDEERLKLHVAAVFCSNFTNHLFALASEFCSREGLQFNYLQSLIEETAHRMQFAPPSQLQTGPAIRRDEPTIQRHLQVLQAYPLLFNLYKVLTQSIQNGDVRL